MADKKVKRKAKKKKSKAAPTISNKQIVNIILHERSRARTRRRGKGKSNLGGSQRQSQGNPFIDQHFMRQFVNNMSLMNRVQPQMFLASDMQTRIDHVNQNMHEELDPRQQMGLNARLLSMRTNLDMVRQQADLQQHSLSTPAPQPEAAPAQAVTPPPPAESPPASAERPSRMNVTELSTGAELGMSALDAQLEGLFKDLDDQLPDPTREKPGSGFMINKLVEHGATPDQQGVESLIAHMVQINELTKGQAARLKSVMRSQSGSGRGQDWFDRVGQLMMMFTKRNTAESRQIVE